MNIKKVAIFTHGIKRGPFALLSTTLARGFEETGVSCDVVVLNATSEEKAKYPNVKVIALKASRAALSLFPLIRYIKEHQPEAIFAMPGYFNIIAIAAKYLSGSNTKVIIGEHNIASLELLIEHGDKIRIRYLPYLMRYLYRYGDGMIGVCQDTINDLLDKIKISPKIPNVVISNPIDVNRIQLLAKEPLDHPWFQSTDIPIILTVARLAKQKQLDVLIKALAEIVKIHPARLLILGDGPLRGNLENLCQELNLEQYVSFPGYVYNPYRLMSACDVFVLASAWEGCPMALEEALACGAATIVNDAPGAAKEIVGHGTFGMVVPNKDYKALAKAIIKVLSDPSLKKYYQKQACKRSQDFAYQKISRKYLDFCNAV